MKKHIFTFLILLIAVSPLYSQKKKNIQMHRLKSTTVVNEDYENSKGKQVKESYTKFDESGNIVEEIEFDDLGKEKKHTLYEYDEDGNKTKETTMNAKGLKDKIVEYKYEDGLKKERIVYYPTGKIKSKKKYVYEYQ